jgi:hypothetical protein
MLTSVVLSQALLAAGVAAHGAVTSYNIAGKDYPGYQGFSPSNSPNVIQWQWPDYNPTLTATDSKVRCNGGRSATLSATAAPGDTITATWQQWTHSQGPVMVWMYKCSGDFSSCDGSGANWFKIDEGGFTPASGVFLDTEVGSGWQIAKLVGGNKSWSSKVPAGLAPGNYLIRHELIALHQANSPQWYAECAQLVVTGSGSASPGSSFKASIPGYAGDSDKNIRFNINDHSAPQTYTMPGPAVYKGTSKRAEPFSA